MPYSRHNSATFTWLLIRCSSSSGMWAMCLSLRAKNLSRATRLFLPAYLIYPFEVNRKRQRPRPGVCYVVIHEAGRPTTKPRTDFGQRMADAREAPASRSSSWPTSSDHQAQPLPVGSVIPLPCGPTNSPCRRRRPERLHRDHLIGHAPRQATTKGPPGKLRLAFEKAHRLPRHEQNQIVKFVEAYADRYASKAS